MTKQQEILHNKRCAEFIKEIPNVGLITKYPFTTEKLKFHSDWNWIMEVVESIEKIKEVRDITITSTGCVIYHKEKPFSSHIENKKEAVVQAINQFLIWYTNHTKDKSK